MPETVSIVPRPNNAGKATAFQLRLGLQGLIVHFKNNAYLREKTSLLIDTTVLGRALSLSARDHVVREYLGTQVALWSDLQVAITAAVFSLERRSVAGPDPNAPGFDRPSGPLIALNYPSLVKDIDRVSKLVNIARNVLACGAQAQSCAAQEQFDGAVLKLIYVCVRVTARGYDGESGPDEEKWQTVINDYKKLLVSCLQVLNNFIAQNPRLKMELWAQLLENTDDDTASHDTDRDLQEQARGLLDRFRKSLGPDVMEVLSEAQKIAVADGRRLEDDWGPFLLLCTAMATRTFKDCGESGEVRPTVQVLARKCFDEWLCLDTGQVAKWRDEYNRTFFAQPPSDYADFDKVEPSMPYDPRAILEDARVQFLAQKYPLNKFGSFAIFVSRAIIAYERNEGAARTASNPGSQHYLRDLLSDWKNMDRQVLEQWEGLFREIVNHDSNFSERWENHGIYEAACALYGHMSSVQSPESRLIYDDIPRNIKYWFADDEPLFLRCDTCGQHFTRRSAARMHEVEMDHHFFIRITPEIYEGAKLAAKIGIRDSIGVAKASPPPFPDPYSISPLDIADPLSYVRDAVFNTSSAVAQDYRMSYGAADGSSILQNAKDELMKKLNPYTERNGKPEAATQNTVSPTRTNVEQVNDVPPKPMAAAPAARGSNYLSEEESDDEYGTPGDDGRGLLTDVPLILGPNEIEVLPIIILTCIIPPGNVPTYSDTERSGLDTKDTSHMDRCNWLLRQDNGRNLLRELLIFVAAWDLREDELYFKLMVKIMEAVLDNGLMKFAYHSFRESKDIISPAQAVIMKLLTNIYRARQVNASSPIKSGTAAIGGRMRYPTRVDVYMVNYLLTEFRQHIIPRTCALIFLQGQIRHGRAHAEDFPLNLWDMERMYEGVYQYLEFFAILTECDAWKSMMADWDITCELVTLLKELNTAVPCSLLAREMEKLPASVAKQHERATNGPPLPTDITAAPSLAAAERAYSFANDQILADGQAMLDATVTLGQAAAAAPIASTSNHGGHEDEPSDFPWKNLKKLTVLVLSSLTWKFRKVQDQVREHQGIEVMLNCTKHDDFNPYIREHAIMALRFLVEGNEENRQVVRDLEAKIARYDAKMARAAAATERLPGGDATRARKKAAKTGRYIPDPMPAPQVPSAELITVGHEQVMNNVVPSASLFDLMTEVLTNHPTAEFKGVEELERTRVELLKALDKEFDVSKGAAAASAHR